MNLVVDARRHGAVVVAVLIAGLLAACGAESSDSTTASTSEGGKPTGELAFWHYTDPTRTWDGMIEDFEKEYPGTKVVRSTYGPAEYDTKLLSAFSSGGEADVFVSSAGEYFNKYTRTGKVADLDQMVEDGKLDLDYYNRAAVDAARGADGKLYSLPIAWFVLALWGNEDLLAEAEVELPQTWDELLAACQTLSDEGVIPIALGSAGQDSWTLGHWYSEFVYQYAGPDGALNATYGTDGASWDDEPFVEAAAHLQQMLDASCFPEAYSGVNYTQMGNLFVRGEAATTFTGTWFADNIRTGDVEFETNVSKFPAAPGSSYDGVVGGVDVIAASERAVQEKEALVTAFLNFVGANRDKHANDTHQLSVAADPQPSDPLLIKATELMESAEELGPVNDVELPAPVIPGYLDSLVALAGGDLSPEEFGAAMVENVERVRAQLPEIQ